MIITRLDSLTIDETDVLLGIMWEVSLNYPNFDSPSNIVASDQSGTNVSTLRVFDVDVIVGMLYYSRARVVTRDTGLSAWSTTELDYAAPSPIDATLPEIPKTILPPTIYTEFDVNEHNHTAFHLHITPPLEPITGLQSTSWFILDHENTVVFSSIRDPDNILEIFVDVMLDRRSIYRVYAQYHLINGVSSMLSGITLYTSDSKLTWHVRPGLLNSSGTRSIGGVLLHVEVEPADDATEVEIEVYNDGLLTAQVTNAVYHAEPPTYGGGGYLTVRYRSVLVNGDEWSYLNFSENDNLVSQLDVSEDDI